MVLPSVIRSLVGVHRWCASPVSLLVWISPYPGPWALSRIRSVIKLINVQNGVSRSEPKMDYSRFSVPEIDTGGERWFILPTGFKAGFDIPGWVLSPVSHLVLPPGYDYSRSELSPHRGYTLGFRTFLTNWDILVTSGVSCLSACSAQFAQDPGPGAGLSHLSGRKCQ